MSFLREFVSLGGVFQGLPRMLVPAHMVFFAVMGSGNAMRVRGQIVKFCGSLMRVFWHAVSPLETGFVIGNANCITKRVSPTTLSQGTFCCP